MPRGRGHGKIADLNDATRKIIRSDGKAKMKLVSFKRDHEIRLGFLLDGEILEPGLARSSSAAGEEQIFRDATSFIRAGESAFKLASRLIEQRPSDAMHPLGHSKLAAPMLPSTILCAGSNYREHNDEKAKNADEWKGARIFYQNVGQRCRPRGRYSI